MSDETQKKPPLGHPAVLISTWFGCGRAKYAPGTVGSLAALPLAWVIQHFYGNWMLVPAALGIYLLGWLSSHFYLKRFGGDDPSEIVIDEVAAQCLILACCFPTWQNYLLGFLLFRLFDVVKPWPISWVDRTIKGAFGIMFDDILAALYPVALIIVAVMVITVFHLDVNVEHIVGILSNPELGR